MAGSGEHITLADGLAAVSAHSLTGVAVGGAGSLSSTFNGGVGVLACGLLGLAAFNSGELTPVIRTGQIIAAEGIEGGSSANAETTVVAIFCNSGGCLVGIPLKDRCGSGVGAEAAAGRGVCNTDVLLGFTIHKVQQETAFYDLCIDQDSLRLSVGTGETAAGDAAVEPEGALAVDCADGVGYAFLQAGSGLFGILRILGLLGSLSGANVELTEEAFQLYLAGTHSGVGLIVTGSEPVGSAIDSSQQGVVGCVVGVNGGSGRLVSAVDVCAVSADDHIDVNLGFAAEGVEVVAALGLLHINIDSSSGISSGGHIVAIHTAGQVVHCAFQVAMRHTQTVGSASLQLRDLLNRGSIGDHRAITLCADDPGVLHLGVAAVTADLTIHGDGIANSRLGRQVAKTGIAILGVAAVDHQLAGAVGNVQITVVVIFNGNDRTGDVVITLGVGVVILAQTQVISLCHGQSGAGSGIGLLYGRFVVHAADQHTASSELDGAVVVGDHTGNGDLVIDVQLIGAVALDAVALDGVTVGLHSDGDVAVVRAVGLIHEGDHTGQGTVVGQGLAGSQRVSLLQNIQRILGSHGSCAAAALNSFQDTTCSELDLTVVVHKATGDGDGVTHSQLVSAVALQTIANNGHILYTGHFDGDGDVHIGGIVRRLDGLDHTGNGVGAFQSFTGSQLVGLLNSLDSIFVDSSGDDVIPADAQLTAVLTGDGSGQHVGSGLSGVLVSLFVDVDGVGAIFILDDLQDFFCHIHRPDDIVAGQADADSAQTGIVHRGLFSSILVEGTQVLDSLLQLQVGLSVLGRCYRSRLSGGVGGLISATGKQAKHHSHCQKHRENSLHDKRPFLLVNSDIIYIEHFDLVFAVKVIN